MNQPRLLTPEMLVPRLGEYLVKQGHIKEADLKKALAYQQKKQAERQACLLGDALLVLGVLDQATLDQAITEQIIQLRTALENANSLLEKRVQERTEELRQALQKLAELNQLKANFVSNISHELRTPLTHVKGYLDLLVTQSLGPLTEDQRNALEVSQRATSRLESLIDGLIMFSQAQKGEMTLKLSPVDINKVAAEIINYSQPKAKDRRVTLHTDIKPKLPAVRADKEKISWVILQLLDNAIKFTPPGGHVAFAVQPESDGLIAISVADTGIGIPEASLKEIFEPFHQLDGSSTRKYGGTGMGLALVHEIVDAHGSTIDVKSKEGKGSLFRFSLLVAKKAS